LKTAQLNIDIKMINNKGIDAPGIPTVGNKPNLGELLLKRYRCRICTGFDALKNFELIDRLEKPVLDFIFYGNKRIILEVYNFISQFPYAFIMRTKKGYDLWSLPQKGSRNVYVYISRFPKLIKFIKEYEDQIPNDLWGIIHGYPLCEIHQFTYGWDEWAKKKGWQP
jgi:hypothetical protein